MKYPHSTQRACYGAFSLITLLATASAGAQTVWSGGGTTSNWSDGTNWVGGSAPASGSSSTVRFSGSTGLTSFVDTPWALGGVSDADATRAIVFALGSGNYTLSGSALTITGAGNNFTSAIINYSAGNQTINNAITMASSFAVQNANSVGTLTFGGAIDNGGFSLGLLSSTGGVLVMNSVISGGGSLVHQVSGGTTQLNAANTYTGATTLYISNVLLGTDALSGVAGAFGNSTTAIGLGTAGQTTSNSIRTNGAYTVGRNFTMASQTNAAQTNTATFGGNTAHVSNFTGNITEGGASGAAQIMIFTAVAGGRVNFTGNILRAAGATGSADTLSKTGAGVVALSGTSYAHEGVTDIQAGTLLVNGTLTAGGAGIVTVQSGAALGGSGTINRDINVLAGGIFSPGDLNSSFVSQAGTLTVGANLTFANTSQLKFDLGLIGSSDTVNITGNLTLDGSLAVTALSGFGTGQYRLFSYTGTFIDNILTIGTTPDGYSYEIVHSAGTKEVFLSVSAIPEPATAAALLGAGGLLAAVAVRRRR